MVLGDISVSFITESMIIRKYTQKGVHRGGTRKRKRLHNRTYSNANSSRLPITNHNDLLKSTIRLSE